MTAEAAAPPPFRVADYVGGAPRRLLRAVATPPSPRDLRDLAVGAVVLGGVFGTLGFATGLLSWKPRPETLVATALSAFLAPGLGEELPFRGVLVPDRSETRSALIPIAGSTALFTLWHVVETAFFPKAAPLFTRPDFLAWAASLGLVCAVLRRRSGSIWPPVLLHWAAVVVWQVWLGGPTVEQLR